MRLIVSFAALFLSVALNQLSSGAIAPLDALSGLSREFSATQIGLFGSAHFFGFFIGCWWSPRLMSAIGSSRTFAAFAALGAIGAIAHPMWVSAGFWLILRVLTGMCVSGCYTVIEAWLQAKLTNRIRGQVMGTYRVIDLVAASSAQLMIGILEPAAYASYNLLAILCCASLLPLTLSTAKAPETPKNLRLMPRMTLAISPLGVAGVLVAGMSTASFRMAGPIYGAEIGLSAAQIGTFLAIMLVGGTFGALMGFAGLIIAVPVAAAIGVFFRFGVSYYLKGRLYQGNNFTKSDADG